MRIPVRTLLLGPLVLLPGVCAALVGAAPQGPQGAGGMSTTQREAMWPAPSAEDWARPVLIQFQRTFEDALALSKETGRPILVCTNMDGEIASEHYAGIRYRQPEIAKLYEPYVCVIASVYRHTPRDHDEEGRRIECPRFGSVTCSEHIAIEPLLFERFFDGVRVAPRHVMVEVDGTEVYDVYYAFDTQSVFDRIQRGIAEREVPIPPRVRGDRSLLERVASRDSADREAVEAAYDSGSKELRKALLEQALGLGADAPLELLRRALFGLDPELAAVARRALSQSQSEEAVHLLTEVLRAPLPADEREELVASLERLGARSLRARTVASVQRGLAAASYSETVRALEQRLSAGVAPARAREEAEAMVRAAARASAAGAGGEADGGRHLLEAEGAVALADDLAADPRFAALLLEDAYRAARAAFAAGEDGWRVRALLARLEHGRGNAAAAREHAVAAMGHLPDEVGDRTAMVALAVFAHGRSEDLRAALAAGSEWPKEWLADVHAAYGMLARHPHGLDQHVVAHHDLMRALGALEEADRVVQAGLERFADSFDLHQRFSLRLLSERGPAALEAWYGERIAAQAEWATGPWFLGYATLLAAEHHRRRWERDLADGAYRRADEAFRRAAEAYPAWAKSADHFAALCLAGQARLALERREPAASAELLMAAFDRCPTAAASADGLNVTPMDTARMLRPRLRGDEHAAVRARLEAAIAALGQLDPRLLELPAYERGGPPPQPNR